MGERISENQVDTASSLTLDYNVSKYQTAKVLTFLQKKNLTSGAALNFYPIVFAIFDVTGLKLRLDNKFHGIYPETTR